jgi:hypothetical protein
LSKRYKISSNRTEEKKFHLAWDAMEDSRAETQKRRGLKFLERAS